MDVELPMSFEAIFLTVAACLEPPHSWQLRGLSNSMCKIFTPQVLAQLRKCWDFSSRPSLVEQLRSADPHAPLEQQKGVLRMVGAYLLADPDAATTPNAAGQTAITWAADYGLGEVLRLLLGPLAFPPEDCDACLRVLDGMEKNGWYPLYRAAWNGRADCVRQLLAARASPEGTAGGRYSPLMAAARWGHKATVAVLLDAGADAARKNAVGESALTLARSQGHSAVVKLLDMEADGPDTEDEHYAGAFEEASSPCRTRHTLGPGWVNLGPEFYSNAVRLPTAA